MKFFDSAKLTWIARGAVWGMLTVAVFALYSASGIIDGAWGDIFPQRHAAPIQAQHPDKKAGGIRAASDEPKIFIRELGIASPLVFPQTTDVAVLKKSLDKGVAHYPGSALPSEPTGNVFLFGHSSAKLYEKNPARTVFTKLNRITPGEEIEIWYEGAAYVYAVENVRILKPGEAEVYLASDSRKLTLSTCWPVGDPSNRFIVEAHFVKSYPLQS